MTLYVNVTPFLLITGTKILKTLAAFLKTKLPCRIEASVISTIKPLCNKIHSNHKIRSR
jgi:hypothetical protein